MSDPTYMVVPIGHVESELTDVALAPKQGPEGAPVAWLVFVQAVREGLRDLHRVRILARADGLRLQVEPLEAVDRTPIIDVKPVLHEARA